MAFNCRVCGATEYSIENNGSKLYTCAGCSVIFKDVDAFSVQSIKFRVIGPYGKAPEKNKRFDSGFDLFSAEALIVEPGETVMVKTNIAIELPPIYEAQIRARSGLAKKHGIQIANGPGTIDNGYRNNIGVLLYNSSRFDFYVEIEDRIAQLVIKHCPQVVFEEVLQLSQSDRGLTGFGDSGISGSIK